MAVGEGISINSAGSKNGFDYSTFNDSGNWNGCIVVRAYDSSVSLQLSQTMHQIVEQSQSGQLAYSQDSRNGIFNTGLGNGMTTADCSSAVSYAINQAIGITPGQTATGNGTSFAQSIVNTGAFMDYFYYQDGVSTPLRVGDILIYAHGGHTAIVMSGMARKGSNDELYVGNGMNRKRGHSRNWGDMTEGEFVPRLEPPIIEPPEEYLPEEIIELLLEGEINKEELEEVYDMYFIYEGRGGYSPFSDIPLNNKTYAWNRFAEVYACQESCPLNRGDPGAWAKDSGGFVVDMAPEWGAAMCFMNPKGGQGYACIVEDIIGGEILITSQVEGGQFSIKERQKRYGAWDFDNYMFTGFVHNPGASAGAEDESALETFLRIAGEQVGSGASWTYQQTQIQSPNGWSAAFIVACSKRAGSSLNIVIPNVDSVSTIGRVGVLRGMGTWHKGAIYGGGYAPSAGDIVIFRYNTTGKESIYMGDKAGIVVESGGGFEAIVGDDGGVVTRKGYSTGSHDIVGYFSPNWEQIDGTTASKKEYRNIQGLYTNGVNKFDACARTVGYINPGYKPSISASKVKLAAVNYTGLLANMYSVFGQAGISTAGNSELVVDFWTNTVRSYYQQFPGDFNGVSGLVLNMSGKLASGLSSPLSGIGGDIGGWYNNVTNAAGVSVTATSQQIATFFKSKGLNDAAVSAILANFQHESGFKTGVIGDSGTSAGLGQWHASRMSNMIDYVGSDWKSNVYGQLNYAWHELQTSYSGVLNVLKNVPNTAEGAREACTKWIKSYEVPQGYDNPNSAVYIGKTDKNGNHVPGRLETTNGWFEELASG